MGKLSVACIQLNSGKTPQDNYYKASALIEEAAACGARYIQTPEMTGTIELDRKALRAHSFREEDDPLVKGFSELACRLATWLHIGSLALIIDDDRLANRSFLFAPDGSIAARYDKIHMFDVDLPGGLSIRESSGYRPGTESVLARVDNIAFGLTICYDLRFSALYRDLTLAGARVLTVPAAFTRETGEAHWLTLLRARAIECAAFVIAAAQTGYHEAGRETWGHSLIIDPWGRVLAEAGREVGLIKADIDLDEVDRVRQAIPGLRNERKWAKPLVNDPLNS